MKIIARFLMLAFLTVGTAPTFAQRARTVTDSTQNAEQSPPPQQGTSTAPVPQSFRAKYEGGVFGYNRRVNGTITFDDMNSRLVFRNNQRQELFTIPYNAMLAAFVDTRSRRPPAATVIGSLPIPFGLGLPALFVRQRYRYLTLQYRDPDTNVAGVTSFKMDNRQVLDIALQTLASKAGLTQRGEIYVRSRTEPPTNSTQTPSSTTPPPTNSSPTTSPE